MTTVLLVGAGATGARARATARRHHRAHRRCSWPTASRRRPPRWRPPSVRSRRPWPSIGRFPTGVDAVAVAVPARAGALDRRGGPSRRAYRPRPSPTTATASPRCSVSTPTRRENGVLVAVGCGLVPGLGDVLARHAADSLDRVDEAHVARVGAGGARASPRCAARAANHPSSGSTRRGTRRSAVGHELVWFPDPVGARECESVAAGRRAPARLRSRACDGRRCGSARRRRAARRSRSCSGEQSTTDGAERTWRCGAGAAGCATRSCTA